MIVLIWFPSQVAATEDEPLNDDWDDDFGGFEGASPTLDEVSTDMAGVEASPSPWAQFSLGNSLPSLRALTLKVVSIAPKYTRKSHNGHPL